MKAKPKNKTLFPNYLMVVFSLGLLSFFILIGRKWLAVKREERLITLVPVATPTPVPPTPTLTLQQIAEIRKREFEAWNAKYGPCKYIPVLMYHHVMENADASAIQAGYLNVAPNTFREQVDYLVGKGYSLLTLDEMVQGFKGNSLPQKPIVLTFDDGYTDFYTYVFPILKEKNLKATLFVISQYVGGEHYANWGQIKEMSDSGLVLIGDHSLNHSYLPKLSKEEEINQIVSAKRIIEDHLGRSVQYFAYPSGGINNTAEEILRENNFLGAVVTTNAHPQCLGLPYEFSRIRIGASPLKNDGL